ncbi:MAG: hypothetical protein ACXVQV_10355 [Actinomycetota bacterium]
MSEDEHEPAPEHNADGTSPAPPPPGLGVPQLGVPSLSPASEQQTAGGSIGQQLPPLVDPAVARKASRASRVRSIRIVVLVVVLGLAGLGWVVRTVREASATPADKQACLAVLSAIVNNGSTADSMMTSLSKADDKTLRSGVATLVTDIQQRNDGKFLEDLNKVIGRCRSLSSDFRSQFNDYCDKNKGSCKHTTSLSPF